MGDDTTPGQGLMEMILPDACMDKPEAVDCAAQCRLRAHILHTLTQSGELVRRGDDVPQRPRERAVR